MKITEVNYFHPGMKITTALKKPPSLEITRHFYTRNHSSFPCEVYFKYNLRHVETNKAGFDNGSLGLKCIS